MANMGSRSAHESAISQQISEADPRWKRDPFEVNGGAALMSRMGVKPVSAGDTDAGRGTTGFDLYRSRVDSGISVVDALQIKTGKLKGRTYSAPSEVLLCTGNSAAPAIMRAILDLGIRWDLLFIAGDAKSETVKYLFLDIAAEIRRVQTGIGVRGPGESVSEPFFVKCSERRISGVSVKAARAYESTGKPLPPGKWQQRATQEFPWVEESFDYNGQLIPSKVWDNPYTVRYSQLVVSLYRLGVSQRDWKWISRDDIPALVASHDFGSGL